MCMSHVVRASRLNFAARYLGMHVADDPPFIQDSGWAEVIRYSSQRCGRGLSCYADCAPGYDEGFGHGYTTDNGDTYKASQYAARSVLLSYLPIGLRATTSY